VVAMLGRGTPAPAPAPVPASSSGRGSSQRSGEGGDDIADLQAWRARPTAAAASASASGGGSGDGIIDADVEVGSAQLTKIRVPTASSQPLLGFNVLALQRYVLMCAQNMKGGGMIDKPGQCHIAWGMWACDACDVICHVLNCVLNALRRVLLAPTLTPSSFLPSLPHAHARQEPRFLSHVLFPIRPSRFADIPRAAHGISE